MKRIMLLAVTAILCIVAAAQTPESNIQTPGNKKSYMALYTASAPVIDGALDEDVWLAGAWGGDFVQFEPNNGSDASQKTEFKVLFDDNYIYVAIKAFDTAPDSISRRISRRDNGDGDLVGIASATRTCAPASFSLLTLPVSSLTGSGPVTGRLRTIPGIRSGSQGPECTIGDGPLK